MNFQQRNSRYGNGVMFAAGIAGCMLIAASVAMGFAPYYEIWLSALLVVSVILHARTGFALSRSEAEVQILRHIVDRFKEEPSKKGFAWSPQLEIDNIPDLTPEEQGALVRVGEAIESKRLDIYLQPIVSLPQRKQRFFEAFSRMRADDGKIIGPASYLDAAIRANRVGAIDNMILLRAVQAIRVAAKQDSHIVVFCNISPATLFDRQFFDLFTDFLDANKDLAPNLVFEFTAPSIEMLGDTTNANMAAIAKRGFSFSIDHVSRLDLDWQRLRDINFRYVKANADLLVKLSDASSGTGLRALKGNLSDAGIDLIVEKVEAEADMPQILSLGIDYGQGNLFGPPLPADHYIQAESALAMAS